MTVDTEKLLAEYSIADLVALHTFLTEEKNVGELVVHIGKQPVDKLLGLIAYEVAQRAKPILDVAFKEA